MINAYQTDENGLPVFDYQSRPDYATVTFIDDANQTLSNTEPTVDPRLDFVVGRPTITYKTYKATPCQSWVRDRGVYGHNCAKRFWVSPESPDMFQGWPWGASELNWNVIRYAEYGRTGKRIAESCLQKQSAHRQSCATEHGCNRLGQSGFYDNKAPALRTTVLSC